MEGAERSTSMVAQSNFLGNAGRGRGRRHYQPCHAPLPRSGLVQSVLCGAPHNEEIGAAWSKPSEEGRDYLSLKLDDPSFNAPIYANLFDEEGGEGYTLLWSRPRKNGE
jgi:hypothetical protein